MNLFLCVIAWKSINTNMIGAGPEPVGGGGNDLILMCLPSLDGYGLNQKPFGSRNLFINLLFSPNSIFNSNLL